MEKTMLDYIKETPDVLMNIIDNSKEYTSDLVQFNIDNKYDGLYLIASGSSYNGLLCALPFIKHILNQDIRLVSPFTLIYHEKDYVDNNMLVAVSQSGCSTNTLNAFSTMV